MLAARFRQSGPGSTLATSLSGAEQVMNGIQIVVALCTKLNVVFNVPIMSTNFIVLSIDILEIILKLQNFTMKHNCKITTLLLIQESILNIAASEILGF